MMFSFILYAHNRNALKIYTERNFIMKIKHVLKCSGAFLLGGTLVYVHKDQIMQCCDKIRQFSTGLCCENNEKPLTIVLLCDTSSNNCEYVRPEQDQANGQNCNCTQHCCCNKDEYSSVFNEFSDKTKSTIVDINCASPCQQAKFKDYTKRFELEYVPSILIVNSNDELIARLTAPCDINTVRTFIKDNIG